MSTSHRRRRLIPPLYALVVVIGALAGFAMIAAVVGALAAGAALYLLSQDGAGEPVDRADRRAERAERAARRA